MSKYIDADRLIRRLENRPYKAVPNFIKMVEEQEAADVQEVVKEWCYERNCVIVAREDFPRLLEVRHGKWLYDDGAMHRCSVCGELSCCTSHYCGECGARMDEEEQE